MITENVYSILKQHLENEVKCVFINSKDNIAVEFYGYPLTEIIFNGVNIEKNTPTNWQEERALLK